MWVYGNGFPKSLNVSKAIDKAAGATRDTEAAKRWEGWGTALKPAYEPIIMARKPLIGTVAANVLRHGTGAINVDGCRLVHREEKLLMRAAGMGFHGSSAQGLVIDGGIGRWPANVILTHAPGCGDECAPGCPVAALDAQSGVSTSVVSARGGSSPNPMSWGTARTDGDKIAGHSDTGGASRFVTVTEYGDDDRLPGELPGDPPFFYASKASRSEREAGCGDLPARSGAEAVDRDEGSAGAQSPRAGAVRTANNVHNHHPTVKPVAVMRWLVRLVTPPGGVVLDPFMGSGTTGVAAVREGVRFIGCEREPDYLRIAEARIRHAESEPEPLLRVRS
jgi:site-specific DNA-methyltransferase (adenine-specific)